MSYSSHNRDIFSVRADVFDKEYWRADEESASRFLRPGRLLVGGVGSGRTLPALIQKGFAITAVDISPVMVEKTKNKFPELDVRVMDIQHTDFPDASFDSIFLPFHTICYVEDINATLRELHRILKPGGTLVFTMVNRLYARSIISGRVFEPKRARRRIMPGNAEMLWTIQATPWDVIRFRRIFKHVHISGRVRLQHLTNPNWKDRVLAALPFLDKSVYFFCTK
ncbi:MAG: class I SAM-dependent methyltransferase [Patescibacteria group bacterium]